MMLMLFRLVALLLLAAWAAAGGCRAAPNVLIVNEAQTPIDVALVHFPVGFGSPTDKQVIDSAVIQPGQTAEVMVPGDLPRDVAPRLRVAPSGSAIVEWLDLPRGGLYTVRVRAAGLNLALDLQERKPVPQRDAQEMQIREIIDRPPSAFDRTQPIR